jgi:hypothetical protein
MVVSSKTAAFLGRPLWVIGIPNCQRTAGNQLPRMRSRAILSRLIGGTCRTSGHRDISLFKVTRTGAAAPKAGLYQERGIQKRAVAATRSTGARIRQPGRTGHRQRCCPGRRSREMSAIWAGNIPCNRGRNAGCGLKAVRRPHVEGGEAASLIAALRRRLPGLGRGWYTPPSVWIRRNQVRNSCEDGRCLRRTATTSLMSCGLLNSGKCSPT